MKTLFTTLIAFGILAFGSTASAAIFVIDTDPLSTVDGIDVGNVDNLLVQDTMGDNSNPETEAAWVNEYINEYINDTITVEYEIKTEDVVYYNTTEVDVFAFELGSLASDFFLVKNSTSIALFSNTEDLNWGVFNALLLGDGFNLNGGEYTISHVTELNVNDDPKTPEVPIPPSVWLFGTGLLGLVGVARRKNPIC